MTKIDVVRRTVDRKSMTIGVEYELDRADGISEPMLGVDLFRRGGAVSGIPGHNAAMKILEMLKL